MVSVTRSVSVRSAREIHTSTAPIANSTNVGWASRPNQRLESGRSEVVVVVIALPCFLYRVRIHTHRSILFRLGFPQLSDSLHHCFHIDDALKVLPWTHH